MWQSLFLSLMSISRSLQTNDFARKLFPVASRNHSMCINDLYLWQGFCFLTTKNLIRLGNFTSNQSDKNLISINPNIVNELQKDAQLTPTCTHTRATFCIYLWIYSEPKMTINSQIQIPRKKNRVKSTSRLKYKKKKQI